MPLAMRMERQIQASVPDLIELMPEIVRLVPEVPGMERDLPGTMPGDLAWMPQGPGSMGEPEAVDAIAG